jgi:hypothetical protein
VRLQTALETLSRGLGTTILFQHSNNQFHGESIGFVIQGSLVQSSGEAKFLGDICSWTFESNGHLSLTADSEIMWDYKSVTCREIGKLLISYPGKHVRWIDAEDMTKNMLQLA